jgi:hypothetical protein
MLFRVLFFSPVTHAHTHCRLAISLYVQRYGLLTTLSKCAILLSTSIFGSNRVILSPPSSTFAKLYQRTNTRLLLMIVRHDSSWERSGTLIQSTSLISLAADSHTVNLCLLTTPASYTQKLLNVTSWEHPLASCVQIETYGLSSNPPGNMLPELYTQNVISVQSVIIRNWECKESKLGIPSAQLPTLGSGKPTKTNTRQLHIKTIFKASGTISSLRKTMLSIQQTIELYNRQLSYP